MDKPGSAPTPTSKPPSAERIVNRKDLFSAEAAKPVGNAELSKLFRDIAAQATEHAFTHFRLPLPELVIEGETYEFTTMNREFAAQGRPDDWHHPIRVAHKATFVSYREPELLAA